MELTARPSRPHDPDRQAGAETEGAILTESLPSLEALGVTPEIVEAAGEIVDSSDVLGVET
jgi:hypothetical protein